MSGRKFNLMDPEPDVRSQGAVDYQYCTRPCPSHLACVACVLRTCHTQPCPSPLGAHPKRYPGTQIPLAASEEPEPALTQGPMQPAWPACDQSDGTVCAHSCGVPPAQLCLA